MTSATLLEKLDLIPALTSIRKQLHPRVLLGLSKPLVGTVLYQAISGPFRGETGAYTYQHHITHAIIRKASPSPTYAQEQVTNHFPYSCLRLSTAQLQYIGPPFSTVYEQWCKAKGITPNIVTLKSGVKAFWIGDPQAKNVVIYYHGKQRTLYLTFSASLSNSPRRRFRYRWRS